MEAVLLRGRIWWKWPDPENLEIFTTDRRIMYLWFRCSCKRPAGHFTKNRPQPHFTVCSEVLHRSLSWKISVTSTCCALRCWTFLCHLNCSRTILCQLFYDLTSWAEKIDQIFLCVITDLNILFWLKLGLVFLSSKNENWLIKLHN
jgi:hypothetical protein